MNEKEETVRAEWQRPELRRLDTRDAEAAGGGSTDLGVLS